MIKLLANYILKVKNATLKDLKKALTEANIEVRSIVQIHKQEDAEQKEDA